MSYARSHFKVGRVDFTLTEGPIGPWYVVVKGTALHLHSDLEIRGGTSNKGSWTGYYATEQDAHDAMDRFLEKQSAAKVDTSDMVNSAYFLGQLMGQIILLREEVKELRKAIG